MKFWLPAVVLLGAFPHLVTAQVAILHIQVIEGEGAVHLAGSRATHPLAVDITDETGKPVEGAAVSFHLPEDGPGGTFANGLRTEVTVTDGRGRAAVHSLQVNRTSGRLAIRIVASKEQARAGMVSFQYIAESPNGSKSAPAATRNYLKWVVVAALAGGAAAAGALAAGRSNAPALPAATTTVSSAPPVTIGGPTLTVGKP